MAGAVDDDIALHVALRRAHAGGTTIFREHTRDFNVFHHLYTAIARAFCKRHAQISRVGFAVAGNPDRALQIVRAQNRIQLARALRADNFHVDAETSRHRCLLLKCLHALRRFGDIHAAALLPAGGEAGFRFEARIKFNPVLAHARHVAIGAHLPDQPCCVPGGTAGEGALFEQQHIFLAQLGQVIGRRATGDAAADDDDFGVSGHRRAG